MRAAHDLIQHCNDPRHTASQRAATLNTRGMIETSLGDYASAAEHLREAAEAAAGFGHALASYMIEDNIAFLEALRRTGSSPLCPTRRPCATMTHIHEPTLLCFALIHEGTVLRRAGQPKPASTDRTRSADGIGGSRPLSRIQRGGESRASPKAFWERTRQSALHRCHRPRPNLRASRSSQLKALLYAGILAESAGERAMGSRAARTLSAPSARAGPHQPGRPGVVSSPRAREPRSPAASEQRARTVLARGAQPALTLRRSRADPQGQLPVAGGHVNRPPRRRTKPQRTWRCGPGCCRTAATRGSRERTGGRWLRTRRTHRTRTAGP